MSKVVWPSKKEWIEDAEKGSGFKRKRHVV